MPEQNSRDERSLLALLTQLAGHLDTTSTQARRSVEALEEKLATTLVGVEASRVRPRIFSPEQSDLFFAGTVPAQRLTRLQDLSRKAAQGDAVPELTVAVRDVPLRSPLVTGAVPGWASGAAVDSTVGPFAVKDGRQVWFDFFRIKQLVTLYMDGRSDPVLLFEIASGKIVPIKPAAGGTGKTYKLVGDTIWVDSRLLAANAPTGSYTGFRISGGEIAVSAAPKTIAGKATIPSTATVTVTLSLAQPKVSDADPSSPFGPDARAATLTLPTGLAFHFSAGGGAIDAIEGKPKWTLYGQSIRFSPNQAPLPAYDPALQLILVPFTASETQFTVQSCLSPFATLAGAADLARAAWALPTATIDIAKPPPAAGTGALAVQCQPGVTVGWQGLQGGDVKLHAPYVFYSPGWIDVRDFEAGNRYCHQEYRLWRDALNPHGTSIKIRYGAVFPFTYGCSAAGTEGIFAAVDTRPLLDRPVKANGDRLDIHSRESLLLLVVSKSARSLYVFDDNILFDNFDPQQPKATLPSPIALALHNALFKLTPVNGVLLFGQLAEDMVKVERANLFLTFGVYAYLPTLPDPYAANLDQLRSQFIRSREEAIKEINFQPIWLWLVCRTAWQPTAGDDDSVATSFHFAPIGSPFQGASAAEDASSTPDAVGAGADPFVGLFSARAATADTAPSDPARSRSQVFQSRQQAIWDRRFGPYASDVFALLDVSSNADQLGVSFASFGGKRMEMVATHDVVSADDTHDPFPLQVNGLDVVARGHFVRAFTLPQISWEPVINLTPPDPGATGPEPPCGPNYYPDDGGPTKLQNNSTQLVPLAPIPVSKFLVDAYHHEKGNRTDAYFTLPFGLRALAYLYRFADHKMTSPQIHFNAPAFDDGLKGGIQLRLKAGSGFNSDEDPMFRGFTAQMDNVLNLNGQPTGASTLGAQVETIFNNEFDQSHSSLDAQRGVPVRRMDISGYGATLFSDWLNRKAQFAETSQARFDVFVGRCAHEIIQVKSILYPWGIRVVRTITLFRVASGYVYRVDSGWKPESDGRFDFRFDYYTAGDSDGPSLGTVSPYEIHPGIIDGLFNVHNIRSADVDISHFQTFMDLTGFYILDESTNRPVQFTGTGKNPATVDLAAVYFDADVQLENVFQGQVKGLVPAKKILGFVQLAPRGIPLTPDAFKALLDYQMGAIGGPLDCVIDIGKSGQKMRINRIDVNNSGDAAGTRPVFVAAARGNVVLPKDGSWSMVAHSYATGDVTPLPQGTTIPLIRIGAINDKLERTTTDLLRIANPPELLRQAAGDTINFGFLQSTNTQKALFLTPAYEKQASDTIPGKLLSKTPPLFADAYRLVNSKAIFPNIGNATSAFGDAIALNKDFALNPATDGGKQVLELMTINSKDGISRLKEDGYTLANSVKQFDLPSTAWYLVKEDYLKVYVEYRAETQNPGGSNKTNRQGVLDFDVQSFADDVAERWKSRLNNVAMVIDLGPFERLVTIKGNFDAKKGAAARYVGADSDPTFPAPQVEFSKDLQPVMDILQVLEELQGGDYAEAMKNGLKIAMSNSADSWEYKFDVAKEISLVRFPPGEAYKQPEVPLKLEAAMKLCVYFNAALSTASFGDPKKLLPTAGGAVDFYGRVSVMCVSLAAATVYAVGQVNLTIAADTKVGPSLRMKFGFGAEIVVGLPVIGNVSLLYMVGVEIYIDSTQLNVSAFLLFQGHAEILEGLVGVTITIEAKGTIARTADADPDKSHTDLIAQVTFGLDITICWVIDISFEESWQEQRQIA